MPQVGKNTVLAPVCRCTLSREDGSLLDSALRTQSKAVDTYLTLLQTNQHKPKKSSSTARPEVQKERTDDCVIIGKNNIIIGENNWFRNLQ